MTAPAASVRARGGLDLAGRPVTVMGLGLFGGGAAVARHLAARGARVTVTDLRDATLLAPSLKALEGVPLRFVLGGHAPEDFRDAALVVANPAVRRDDPHLALARANRVPITSEIALFLDAVPARVAAITGTQGKSSTCHMLAQLLEASGRRTWLGGNIGKSLLDVLDEMRDDDVAVVELSSYQLETLPDELVRPRERSAVAVAGIVNVLPDHIERHGSLEAYAHAKLRLLEIVRPGGAFFVERALLARFGCAAPADLRVAEPPRADAGESGIGRELADAARAASFRADFQRANALFAAAAARELGASEAALAAAIGRLEGLPHRLEPLGRRAGHPVWDNGVSTTPDSTISALNALPKGMTLVCGGKPKALALEELVELAAERARRAIVFGAAASEWIPLFRARGLDAHPATGVEEAVRVAFERMEPGEGLLFSPAAASFDAWPNFRERALAFRRALPPEDPPGASDAR